MVDFCWLSVIYIVLCILEKAMAHHSSTLAWKIPWTEEPGGLVVHGVARSQTWLSNFTFTFQFHALEKEMATHSSVLAWRRIPGMVEPGGLPSMGSHRVGHDWSDLAAGEPPVNLSWCIWRNWGSTGYPLIPRATGDAGAWARAGATRSPGLSFICHWAGCHSACPGPWFGPKLGCLVPFFMSPLVTPA